MDVRMPDGTIITGVPENITQADLLARYNKFATPAEAPPQTGILADAAKREAAKSEAFSGFGSGLADLGKMVAGSAISGTASVPSGAEQGIKGLARQSMEGKPEMVMPSSVYQPGLDTEETLYGPETDQQKAQRELNAQRAVAAMPSVPGAQQLSQLGRQAQKGIEETLSPETKKAIKESQVTGNLLKGEIDFGSDPSVRGYAMQAASVFGSMAPIVFTAVATKSPVAGGGMGGGMAADEAAQSAAQFIAKKTDDQLMAESPFYAQMIAGGADPKEARALTIKKAGETGAAMQGVVALAGDTFTGKLVTGSFEKLLTKVAGKSALGKAGAGVGLSSLEQGVSETAEGIASDIGTASVVPTKEIGEDSAANLVMGVLGGVGPGALGGFAKQEEPSAKKPVEPDETIKREPYVREAQGDAEALARSKGFLTPEAASTELLKETEPAKPTAQTKVPESESQDFQAMMAELEAQLEGKPAPVKAEEPTPVAEESSVAEPAVKESLTPEPVAEEPVVNQQLTPQEEELMAQLEKELSSVSELQLEEPVTAEAPAATQEVQAYDSPDLRLKQNDALGDTLEQLVYGEMQSYGRAALKKRSLTAGYADKKDNWTKAMEAGDQAFATNDYSAFEPYAALFPKTAKKLQAHLTAETKTAPIAATAATNLQVADKDIKGKHDVINTASDFNDAEFGWLDADNKLHMQYADGTPVKHYAGDKTSTGVANLTPITNADEARAAVSAGKQFVTVGEDSAAVKEAAPVAAPAAAKPARKVAKETPLRQAAYTKNPFMTFLASRGLYHAKGKPNSMKSEFSPDKNPMISGYGPVFKASGMQLDEMLPIAIEYGYLPQDATESDLEKLITAAISGKKVEPLYSEQGVEDTAAKYEARMAEEEVAYEERAAQTDAEWHGMSEAEYVELMAREVAAVSDEDFAEIDQAINELTETPAGNMSVRAAMEALGFTEQEIQDEENRNAPKADEAVAGEPTQGDEAGQAAPTLELETQTAEELKAKQAEVDRLTKENERLSKQAEAKAKADAERDEFVLTGSDRPADVAAAQGQKDIFSAMEEEAPAAEKPKSNAVVTFIHKTDSEPGQGSRSGHYPGTYAYEAGFEVPAIFAPNKKNTFTGSLKESEIYTMTDSEALKREASEAGFPYRQASGFPETQYLQSLGYKAMRRGPEIIVFDAKDANFKKAKPEVASEVVGPAEKPAAPQLTREPVTIEGEFTEVGEEKQRDLINTQAKKLSDAQTATLEKFYGFARDTEEFANAVRQDVVNFITKGATYVNGKIRAIIRSMANGVLSVAVAFNPQFVSMPYTIAVPQFETRIEQVMQEVPASVQKQMSEDAKRAYATIYPAIKADLTKNDKFFIVADKQTANTFVFNPDGSPFMHSKTLFGIGIGDFMKGDNNIVANRITPAGLFNLGLRDAKRSAGEAVTAGEYDFGKVFVLDKSYMGANGPYSNTIMHSVWTKETDAKQRLAALQKPGAEDSRYSFGCINVDKATYGQLVEKNLAQMDGAKIFIVPENGTDVMSFVNGKATYSTDIIRQRAEPVTKEVKQEVQRAAPKAETERTVAAKEEEGPVFNSIEAETAGWSPSRIDQLINEFGYADGRTFGMAGYVNPADFVKATTPTLEAAEMLNEEAGELDADAIRAQRQTPFLFWDIDKGAIIDHEGRHRMAALARAGVTRAPVVLVVKDRYGSKKPDHYTPEYGTFLSGQGFQGGKGQGLSVKDLVPLSYEYKEKLGQEFGKEGFLYSLNPEKFFTSAFDEERKRSPSFKRRMDKLNRDRLAGKITDDAFINETDWALKQMENIRLSKEPAKKERGYLEIVKRLADAAKHGDISKDSFDLATWFMRNNEALVDDLGVAIRGKGKDGVGGQYETMSRVMFLVKGAGSNLTVVHEILHHLERMMPVKVQQAIRKAWAKQLLSAQKKAKTPAEKLYFNALIKAHYGNNNVGFLDVEDGEMSAVFMKALAEMDFEQPGNKSAMKLAETLLKMGVVPYQNYQFFNPSEFWAVNGSDIVQGRFDAVQGGVLARLKNWLKELGQKIKGLFGLDSKASIIQALDSLAKGDGTFVTKEMLGEGEYKNIRRNYEGNEAPAASWESPEESKMDNFIYKLQDKLIDTKRVIQSIKKASGEIADNWDAYLKEELFHGRAAKRTQDFMNREMLPILEEMKDQGVTLDQFEEYLHMRHAEERNIQIAKVNPKMPGTSEDTSGSGISTERANKYLADLSAEQKKTFASLAKKFDKIIDSTQKLLVESGLEKQDTIDAWNGAYEHYVPLMRDDLDFKHHGKGVGAGYSTRGGSSKSAVGSTKKVIDIFATVALQRERAIVRAEKARVGRALYGLAIKNPNPGFWLPINPEAIKNKEKLIEELEALGLSPEDAENIIQEPKVPAIDKKTGLVKYQVNPLMRNSDNVFPVRINGEDRYIFFNTSDERAIRMVEALKNLDAEQLGVFLGSVATVTRWIASVNTQYNPVFGLWNFVRDVQGAAFNLTTTDIAGREKEVIDGVFPALKGIYTDLRQNRKKKTGDSEWAKLFEQYELAGGQTGYRDQFSQSEKRANIVKREMEKLNHGNVRKTAEAMFNWLSDYNDAMENAVRLSAFKVALDQGLSEERAASIAKNLTVNFNRKGAASPTLQSLYAFFNAAVQGTTRLVETLRGPSGKKIMAGGLAIGVAQAIALAMAGFDDEDPPEFLKNKNLIIPDFVTGSGNYLVIPMPLGFNIFPGIGRLTTEYVLGQAGFITGAKGAGDKMISMASLILDSFNPLGSGSILQMAAPTVVDPIVAIGTNRDAFGRPISKEDRATAPTPGYTRSRENASWFSKQLAEFLNYVSSPMGTKYTKGVISPTADQIDYLIGQYTGGVGREAVKTAQYGVAAVKGETGDLPSYKVPLLGKLYGETESPAAISSKFYENVTKLAEHENEIKMRIKNKDDIREYRAEHPETRFIHRVNNLENQITAINKQKKALQEREAPEERIKKLDERKTKLMKDFNDQIKRLERQ